MIKKVFFIISILLISKTSFASPSITAISYPDGLTNLKNLTISGSNFGTHADNSPGEYLHYWEDCEDQNLSNVFTYVNDFTSSTLNNRHPFSEYSAERDHGSSVGGIGFLSGVTTTDGFFSRFWVLVPLSVTFSSTGQVKLERVGNSGANYPNITVSKHQFTASKSHYITIEGDPASDSIVYNKSKGSSPSLITGEWINIEFWFKPSTGIGNMDGQIIYNFDGVELLNDSAVLTDDGLSNNYSNRKWATGEYYKGASAESYFDDFYKDFTQARVLACEGSIWGSRGYCEPLLLRGWSTTEIWGDFYQGNFSTDETIYFYVIDSSGSVSSPTSLIVGEASGSEENPEPDAGEAITEKKITLNGVTINLNGITINWN